MQSSADPRTGIAARLSGSAHAQVRDFWETASCGEIYAAGDDVVEQVDAQARERYRLEPYILDFARFKDGAQKDVLEIGVGMGADHEQWAKAGPRRLAGVDLTARALAWTQRRLQALNLHSHLLQADAEALPFPDESFDIVYSWGVLHHTPKTSLAIQELHRVLRPGGTARLMLYHRHSITGAMLWLRYGVPRRLNLNETYSRYLESPGTKAFSIRHIHRLTHTFSSTAVTTQLGVGDLLDGGAGMRYRGRLFSLIWQLWPRPLIRRYLSRFGLLLLVEASK